VDLTPRIGRNPEMNLLRRKALRAASLVLLLAALAAPAYALPGSPTMSWNPEGYDYGDPDPGGGGIQLRNLHTVLMFVLRRIAAPTSPAIVPPETIVQLRIARR
jgi:hypothetical protein